MRKRDLLLIAVPLCLLGYFVVSLYFIVRIPDYQRFSIWWKISFSSIVLWLLLVVYILLKELIIPSRQLRAFMKSKTKYKGHSLLPILEGVIREIERMKADGVEKSKALKEVAYLRRLSEYIIFSFPNYLFILDADKKILFVNGNAVGWLEREIADLIGKSVESTVPKDLLKECGFQEMWEYVNRKKDSRSVLDVEVASRSSLRRVYNVHLSPIFVNEKVLFSLTISDITSERRKEKQMSGVRHLSELLRSSSTPDIDRFLFEILTAVTSGSGAGFNRAFILVADDEKKEFRGRIGVGPMSEEEAYRIWGQIAEQGILITDLMLEYDRREQREDLVLHGYAKKICVSYDKKWHVVMKAATERRPWLIKDAQNDQRVDRDFLEAYRANAFVAVPVEVKGKVFGVILADNLYSREPIGHESVDLIVIFAVLCGLMIENARMYQSLDQKMQELQQAYADLKSVHDELLHKEQLAVVGEMAAVISHEIRNPLATIGGFARSMEKNPEDRSLVEESVDVIIEEVEELEEVLAHVMDFAKPLSPVLKNENLNGILRETLEFFKKTLKERRIKVTTEYDDNLTAIPLDRKQIKQVFLNIIKNSIESMDHKGMLSILSRLKDDDAVVEITDSGCGMDEYTREHAFDPFFTTKEKGVGLGLALCRRIVERHGGTIELVSGSSGGTTSRLVLPLRQ